MKTKKSGKTPVKAAEANVSAVDADTKIVDDLDNDYQTAAPSAEKNPVAEKPILTPAQTETANNAADAKAAVVTNGERAEVNFDGVLGTKRLTKGAVTDDAEYIALAKTPRGARYLRLLTE